MQITRKIVDSNFLRSTDLTKYLAGSSSRRIVLTEFILMEQFKKNASVTVRNSFEICSKFSRQVITLKRSPEILRVATRGSGLAKRMIDQNQTAAFPEFCSLLVNASRANAVDSHIRRREKESVAHMAQLLDDCRHVPAIFDRISKTFTQSELTEIRKRTPLSGSTQTKLLDTMFDESRRLYLATDVEEQFWPPTIGAAINSYPFRYALCLVLLYMRWIKDGKPRARAPEKVRNDVVDANTAAFATYFDGVLSNDVKLKSVHNEARYLLTQMDGYIGGTHQSH